MSTNNSISDKIKYVYNCTKDMKTALNNKGVTVGDFIGDYAQAIDNIQVGITPTGTKDITTNGTVDVTNYANVNVNVPNKVETKTITSNGTYTPSTGNIGFSNVVVNVPSETESISVTENGTYMPSANKLGFNKVVVNVSIEDSISEESKLLLTSMCGVVDASSSSIEVDLKPISSGKEFGWQVYTGTNKTPGTMYKSLSAGVASSYAIMKVTFSGFVSLICYINSYAESNYDYTIISKVDAPAYPKTYSDTNALANTRGKQYSPSTFSTTNWTTVTINSPDLNEHYVYVVFVKDSSGNNNDDAGYFSIDLKQIEG